MLCLILSPSVFPLNSYEGEQEVVAWEEEPEYLCQMSGGTVETGDECKYLEKDRETCVGNWGDSGRQDMEEIHK